MYISCDIQSNCIGMYSTDTRNEIQNIFTYKYCYNFIQPTFKSLHTFTSISLSHFFVIIIYSKCVFTLVDPFQ